VNVTACGSAAAITRLESVPAATVLQHGRTGRRVVAFGDEAALLAQHGAHSVRAGEHRADACCAPAVANSSATSALTHRAAVEWAGMQA
jgi:hypothetical protein